MRRFFRPKRSAICPEAKEAMSEETALMVMRLAMAERGEVEAFANEDEHERPYHAGANHADEHPPEEEPKLRRVFFSKFVEFFDHVVSIPFLFNSGKYSCVHKNMHGNWIK